MQIEPTNFVQVYRGSAPTLPSLNGDFAHAKSASPVGCQQVLGQSQLSMVSINKSRDGNLSSQFHAVVESSLFSPSNFLTMAPQSCYKLTDTTMTRYTLHFNPELSVVP